MAEISSKQLLPFGFSEQYMVRMLHYDYILVAVYLNTRLLLSYAILPHNDMAWPPPPPSVTRACHCTISARG